MIGLEFESENVFGETIGKLIQNIKLTDYDWYFFEDDIMNYEEDIANIPKNINKEVFDQIILKSNCLILFINVQIYPKGSSTTKIKTYSDFLNSECALILLVVDGCGIDIYCKSEEVIYQIEKNAADIDFIKIKRKTKENDGRTRMQLW